MPGPPPAPPAAKVLIIDDDKAFVDIVIHFLQKAGYRFAVAVDAMQGFMFAQREAPDLILLDLQMPAGGGMQLLQKVRAHARTRAIPILMVTAARDPKLEAEAKTKGAQGFLSKPVDEARLLRAIQPLLAPRGNPQQ